MESYRQNNFTADLASEFLSVEAAKDGYWLGLRAYNQLQTNTLEADAGHQVSLNSVHCILLTLENYFMAALNLNWSRCISEIFRPNKGPFHRTPAFSL